MNIRRIGKGIAALLALVVLTAGALTLVSCFSPLTGTETQGRFVIGGSSARAYFDNTSDTDIAQLTLDITVSDGPGPEQRKTGSGGEGVPFTVNPGTWTITVRAYFNDNFAAYGSMTVNIAAGDNIVEIKLHTIEAGLYRVDGGTYTRVDDVAGNNVAAAIAHINAAGNAGTYMLFTEPTAPISVGTQTLGAGEHLTLIGITPTTIQLSGMGTLFTINTGASLVLDSGIILTGADESAVRVASGGTFTMIGGTISGNVSSDNGGGVYVASGGRFSKTGGIIYGNDESADENEAFLQGHAVYVDSTPPKFRNRTVDENTSLNSATDLNWDSVLQGAVNITVSGTVVTTASVGDMLTADYTGSEAGTKAYQWNMGGVPISGENNPTYTPTATGSFTVTLTITGYPSKISAVVTVTNSSTTFPTETGLYRVTAGPTYTKVEPNLPENLTSVVNYMNSQPAADYLMLMIAGTSPVDNITLNRGNLTIQGIGVVTTTINMNEYLLTVTGTGTSLTLAENITFQGDAGNDNAVISAASGGTLTMKAGSSITGNTNNGTGTTKGGAVYIDGGTFTLDGGRIHNNTAPMGGGVYMASGTFTLTSGSIENNHLTGVDEPYSTKSYYGGGLYMTGGTANLNGGEIKNHVITIIDASSSGGYLHGGGVYANAGILNFAGVVIDSNILTKNFPYNYVAGGGVYLTGTASGTMTTGSISNNIVHAMYGNSRSQGGGLYMDIPGNTFTMSGGSITLNKTEQPVGASTTMGGGVYVDDGTFEITGSADIHNNTAGTTIYQGLGGGVYKYFDGTVTMTGGAIRNNQATTGGGVYADASSTPKIFTKSGGSEVKDNTLFSYTQHGLQVWIVNGPSFGRDSSAGIDVNLDQSVSGVGGGWDYFVP